MDEAKDVVAAHGTAVWRAIARLIGRTDRDAEDCFQDTFVEFWALARSRQVQHAEALLVRIATRRAIDAIRRRIVTRRRVVRVADDADPSASRDPAALLVDDELAMALTEALADLPEAQAVVFCMTQLDGMDHAQVASVLGRSPNHVAVLLRRSRVRLQKQLAAFNREETRIVERTLRNA
jgi:RNA polymerase sigma-70 factor (ECF subfamily)